MAVLVTGGAGFIGAEVVRGLVERDEAVHVASHSGRLQRLADLGDRITIHRLDLADTAAVAALVAAVQPRVVHHLGAMLSGPSEAEPQACVETNAFGTYALLEAARINEVEQFCFASSIGTYAGTEQPDGPMTDESLQRPDLVYGVTKVFGELLGRFYKKKYGLDFRGIRYPAIVGPGVSTWSLMQCTSWVIERSVKGEPFTMWTPPGATFDLLYFKEAGTAMLQLADAPLEAIRSVNYNLGGAHPRPSMQRLVDAVVARVPGARVDFEVDPQVEMILAKPHPIDDARARAEWGWVPRMDCEAIVEDFIEEMGRHPERYS